MSVQMHITPHHDNPFATLIEELWERRTDLSAASATKEQIAEQGHILTPGRYVGSEESEADDEPLDKKIKRLQFEIEEGFQARANLQSQVVASLRELRVSDDG